MGDFTIDPKNYAADSEKAEKALDFMRRISTELQTRRSVLNEKYLQYYNIYKTVFDIRFYNGESQVYIPELRKAVEQFVSRVKRALFPTDDVFEVEPVDPEIDDESEVVRDYMKFQIEKRVKLKAKVDRFLRQLAMYGWAIVECGWEEDIRRVVGLQKVITPVTTKEYDPISDANYEVETGETTVEIQEVEKELVKKRNPTFEPIDNFAAYLWPHTANDIDEVYGVVTLSKQTFGALKRKQADGFYENVDLLMGHAGDVDDQWQWTLEARLNIDGLTDSDQNESHRIPRHTLIKYNGLYNWGTDEDPDEHETTIVTVGGRICLELRKNQYYDQDKPFLLCRLTELQNEVYTSGLIEPLASLQYYLNDTAGQTFDGNYYSLNPIVKYDPGRVVNINSIAFAPGAMWALTDPSAADIVRPPDVANVGFNIMANVKTLIEEYPGLQNIPLTGRKAALHISALQQEFALPVQNTVENIEENIMSPWLKKAYCRIQQFMNKEDIVRVTGKDGFKKWRQVSPENLVGDYNFYWRGANQSVNLHVKSQQIAQWLGIAAPWLPLMLRKGDIPDITWILKRYWTEALGMDGADKAITSIKDERALPPDVENIILALGKPIPTSLADNPEEHIQVHQQLLQADSQEIIEVVQKHIEQHQMDLQEMQRMMQQSQVQQAAQPQEPEGPGEVPGERQLEGEQQAPNLGGRF